MLEIYKEIYEHIESSDDSIISKLVNEPDFSMQIFGNIFSGKNIALTP
jgi:hypothetical protein